ncbi:ribonuclease H-like domain-containing protein [Tanacetum coccineum]
MILQMFFKMLIIIFFDIEYPVIPNDDERVANDLNKGKSDSSSSSESGSNINTANFLVDYGNDVDSSNDFVVTQNEEVVTLVENAFSEVRCLLNIDVSMSWLVFQLDVNNAFLYGDLEEVVFMKSPEGYFPSDNKLVYVDDIIITGNSIYEIEKFKVFLKSKFMIKDLGKLKYFLGIEVVDIDKGIFLNQRKYVLDILSEYGMLACKPAKTSLMPKLVISNEASDKDCLLKNITDYQKLMRKLIYLTNTRPDISYVVHCLRLGVHITKTFGMFFTAYSNVDWAKCIVTRKYVTGYYEFLNNSLVSWKNKKQNTLSKSSTEAEYRDLASAASEGLELVSIWRIQCLGYGVLGFLGVRTTFDIFENIHLLYLQYGILVFSRYGVLIMWSSSLEFFFEELCASYEVDKYLRSPINETTTTSLTPLTPEEIKVDKIVLSWIHFTLFDSFRARIVVARPKFAKEAWSLIFDIVKDNKRSRTNTLKADLDARVNKEDVVHYTLEGLPDTYNHVCGYMHSKDIFPDLKAVPSLLIAEEMRLKSKVLAFPVDASSPMVLVAETSTNSRSSMSQGHLGMNVAMSNNGTNVTLPTHATVTGPNIASNVPTAPHAFYASPVHTTMGTVLSSGVVNTLGQATWLPQAFTTGTLYDPTTGAWNMDTCASSHLNNSITSLITILNSYMYSTVSVGDGYSIPVTNTGHSILSTPLKSLRLNNVLITPHIDFMTRWVLLRCDSTGDLYPVTAPSPIPSAFLISQQTWHQRLGHPGSKVLRCLVSNKVISCNKEKPLVLYHACQLGKHVRLPYAAHSPNVPFMPQSLIIHTVASAHSPTTAETTQHTPAHVTSQSTSDQSAPNITLNPTSVYSMVTRFRVGFNKPTQHLNFHVSSVSPLPKTYRDAFYDSNWQNAMRDEYDALIKNSTWTLLPRPPDANVVCRMWLFRHKFLADATLSRYKARLMANGSTQLEGVHVDETFSPVKYAVEILEKAHMLNCNPSQTPVDTESKLGVGGDPVSDPTLYQSLAGSLHYLTFTRPNISYVVQQVFLHMHDPREPHLYSLKRILRYVQGTLNYGLQLFSSSITDLVAYSDADWAGCPTTRRSTFGYCVFLGNNLLSWSSKRQPMLSRSSAEAKYRGVANVVAETCWLRNLLHELHTPLSFVMLVYCDNVSAIYLSCNPVQHQRTKHIEIDIHFVRDLVVVGQVRVLHVHSRYQFADIFTKGLPSALFEEFRTSLSIRCPSAPTAGEC